MQIDPVTGQSTGILSEYQLLNMQFNQTMSNIQSKTHPSYYSYIYDADSMTYENGWELLLLNIGRYPNLSPNPTNDFTDIPYIVLYNRYKGIIRLFANYGDGFISTNTSINAITVELKFDSELAVNGLLRLTKGLDQALDQKTDALLTTALTVHPNRPNQWFSADFQVAYDPCVCYFPSNLRFNFYVAESSDLKLIGRSIGTEQSLIEGNHLDPKDFITNFSAPTDGNRDGLIIYKALNGIVDDYLARYKKYEEQLQAVNEHNDKIKKNTAIIKAFKSIVLSGGGSAITQVINSDWFGDLATYASDLVGLDSINKKKLITSAKDALGKEVGTFISKNFSEKPLPAEPIAPTATFTEFNFKGTLSQTTVLGGPNFYTPGTYGSQGTGTPNIGNVSSYPVYNDVLGAFALLETPVVNVSTTTKAGNQFRGFQKWELDSSIPYEYSPIYLYGRNYSYQSWDKLYQFQLVTPLKYTFNNTVDLNEYDIQTSFVIEAKPKKNNLVEENRYINCFNEPLLTTNFTSKDVNVNTKQIIQSVTGDYSNGSNINSLSNSSIFPVITPPRELDTFRFETEFFPIDAFKKVVAECAIQQETYYAKQELWAIKGEFEYSELNVVPAPYLDINNPLKVYNYDIKVYLKMMITSKFNTLDNSGQPNETFQVYTYEIPSDHINWLNTDIVANLVESNKNLEYGKDLNIKNVSFDGSQVQGCVKNGTTYTCKAWNSVTLEGNINVSSGFLVNIIGGKEVITKPESVLTGELIRLAQPLLDLSDPMPVASKQYVTNFCKGQNPNSPAYRANIPAPSALIDYDEYQKQIEKLNKAVDKFFNISLFPNPTNSTVTIQSSIRDKSIYSIQCSDLSGKLIELDWINLGSDTFKADVSKLSKGMYLIKVNSYNGEITKQLIVN